MAERPVVLLVTGLPATGKSTLAARIAPALGAPVLGWDWMMGALTRFDRVEAAIAGMDSLGHRSVGWSLLWQTADAQLRRGMSVVLDGVARDHEVAGTRALAQRANAGVLVIMTTCDDEVEHRARVEGRDRAIPGWHELTWRDVQRTKAGWRPPTDIDLVVDTLGHPDYGLRATVALVGSLARAAG